MVSDILKSPDLITDQICARFREEIISGKYSPNEQLPSFGVLADNYKISKSTVHEAFKILAQEGFLFIKHGKGAFVNPAKIEHQQVRALKDVAILAFNIFSPNDNYMVPFLEAINAHAKSRDIRLHFHLISGMSLLTDDNRLAREAVADRKYDGLIIASPVDTKDIQWLSTVRVPFVAASSRYALKIPQVLLDNSLAAQTALSAFRERGVKKAAVFTGPLSWQRENIKPHAREIAEVFEAASRDGGPEFKIVSCEYGFVDIKSRALEFLSTGEAFDGLFFQGDLIAKGVLSAFREKGLSPDDKVLVNYFDIEDDLAQVNVRKPLREAGEEAFALLERVLLDRTITDTVVLKPELVKKENSHG